MRVKACCAHPSIRDHWALRCMGRCPDQVDSLNCRTSKWESKTRDGVLLVSTHATNLEENIKQQPVWKDSTKDVPSDSDLEIELVIPFAPNQDPQDISQQLQLGEVMH
ncbi:uncharacterized protein TNCV_1383971 [Trichonephila clavipes]|nr:uncharacterized protein TNCV_1383971 [Trichonephila clavipes]